jgi:hypothetical protein
VFLIALAIVSSAALPGAAATPVAVATPVAAATPGAVASAGKSGSSGTRNAGASRSNLLCAGLLGSSFLGNVLTVAPLPGTHKSDPDTAIQFTLIWSDLQHATVGGQAPVAVAHARPVVAVVKLPIEFSPATATPRDRQRRRG